MEAKIQVNLLTTLNGHRQSIYTSAILPNAGLLSAGGDGMVVQWLPFDNEDGVALASVQEPVYALLGLADDHCIVGGHHGYIYEIKNRAVRKITAHKNGVFRFFQTENEIISIGGDGVLMRWTYDLDVLGSIKLSDSSLRSIVKFPGGWAIGSGEGKVYFLSPDFEIIKSVKLHEKTVFALAFNHNTGVLLSGGLDAIINRYQIDLEEDLGNVAAHLLHIHDLKMSPDGRLMASASMDKSIKIWDPSNMELLKVLNLEKYGRHASSVNHLTWLNDSILASCSDDRSIGIWEII